MKKTFLAIVLLFSSSFVIAQEEEDTFSHKKGSLTASLLLGSSTYINSGTVRGNTNVVGEPRAFNSTITNGSNSLTNMIGFEGKYFIKDNLAITFTGGGSFRNTPSQLNIPAVDDLPAYNAVIGVDDIDVSIAPGLQWYSNLKGSPKKLLTYVGFSIPFNYSRYTQFDPTVAVNGNGASVISLGESHGELAALGVNGIAGLDYYLTKDLFIGFDVKPVTFNYIVGTSKVAPGTLGREADNYSLSFFSSYVFKIGFNLF